MILQVIKTCEFVRLSFTGPWSKGNLDCTIIVLVVLFKRAVAVS